VEASAIMTRLGGKFRLGTLVINVTGSFLIGFLMSMLTERFKLDPNWRLLLVVGFLGGYTTFRGLNGRPIYIYGSRIGDRLHLGQPGIVSGRTDSKDGDPSGSRLRAFGDCSPGDPCRSQGYTPDEVGAIQIIGGLEGQMRADAHGQWANHRVPDIEVVMQVA